MGIIFQFKDELNIQYHKIYEIQDILDYS